MKKMNYIWIALTSLMLAAPVAHAEDALKVGVVNAAAILDKSPQKAAALARLEKEFSSRSQALDAKHKEILAAQDKLKKDGAILSAEDRKKRERDILSDQRELKRKQDEFSEDLSIRRNEELRKLEKQIASTIVELAKKDKYDVVLYQGVVFASDKVDITNKVLEMLDAKAKQ